MTTISPEGGDAAAASGGGGGDQAPAAPFYEAFADVGLKASPAIQRYKTAEELAAGYVNLEKRFGVEPSRRIDLPADPNDADGMRAVYAKLGLPEKPDGYGLKLDDKATDADKALVTAAKEAFHKAGMPDTFAKAAFEFWGEQAKAARAAAEAAQTAQVAAGKDALTKEFGAAAPQRLKEIEVALGKYFAPKIAEVMKGDGLFLHAGVALGIAKMVERMAEPGAAGGQSGDGDQGERQLTPAQAQAAVTALTADPVKGKALLDANHPMHKAVIEERRKLLAMASGRAA